MLTPREIEYIIAVDRTKSITKAAQLCYASQPALTMQINSIEKKLGFKLFNRDKGNINTTHKGTEVIKICIEIMQKLNDISNIGNELSHIKIGIIPTISQYLLPKISTSLGKVNAKVSLFELKTNDIISRILSGEMDCGVLSYYKDIIPKNLKYRKLYEEELLFISHKSDLIKINDAIESQKIILLDDGNCLNISIADICNAQQKKHIFSATSIEVVKAMIFNNNGYGIIPQYSINKSEVESLNIQSFQPKAIREVGIIYRNDDHLNDLLSIFAL